MFATGQMFKMTRKTRLFLLLHHLFTEMGQWFINNCDFEGTKSFKSTEELFKDLDGGDE